MTFDPDWKDRPNELGEELRNFNSQWGLNKPKPTPTRVVNMRQAAYDVYIGRAGKGQDGFSATIIRLVIVTSVR